MRVAQRAVLLGGERLRRDAPRPVRRDPAATLAAARRHRAARSLTARARRRRRRVRRTRIAGRSATACAARPGASSSRRARVRCTAPSRSALFNMSCMRLMTLLAPTRIRGISPSTGISNSFCSARASWTDRSRNSRPSAATGAEHEPGDDGHQHELQRLGSIRRAGQGGGIEDAEPLAPLLARHVFGHARVVEACRQIVVATRSRSCSRAARPASSCSTTGAASTRFWYSPIWRCATV